MSLLVVSCSVVGGCHSKMGSEPEGSVGFWPVLPGAVQICSNNPRWKAQNGIAKQAGGVFIRPDGAFSTSRGAHMELAISLPETSNKRQILQHCASHTTPQTRGPLWAQAHLKRFAACLLAPPSSHRF